MTILKHLQAYQQAGLFEKIDLAFARYLRQLQPECPDEVVLAGALVAAAQREGHVCLDLEQEAGKTLGDNESGMKDIEPLITPGLEEWLDVLEESKLVGKPGEYRPMILENGRLYLHRYWHYEQELANKLKKWASAEASIDTVENLQSRLDAYFPGQENGHEVDWQKVAALAALTRKLTVISGGPGTGKTTTVVRIMALLLEQSGEDDPLHLALCAPTGKAAARLNESIDAAIDELSLEDDLMEHLPRQAVTLHSLLGARPHSGSYRYNTDRRLPYDGVIVDEASMVDLALMTRLVEALPDDARLILLGDRDQLASVEAGSVLGDISGSYRENGFSNAFVELAANVGIHLPEQHIVEQPASLTDHIVLLQHSYRFGAESGIGRLAAAVNRAESSEAVKILDDDAFPDVTQQQYREASDFMASLEEWLYDLVDGTLDYAESPAEALEALNRKRLLCAHRRGPMGVETLNNRAEQIVRRHLNIPRTQWWYPGRAVMVTRNDYALKLRNGDVGLTLIDPDDQKLKVWFRGEDGLRALAPQRLRDIEPVWATTVHKSQGSEFERVVLVLPNRLSAVTTRELIYTAITRARSNFEVWGKSSVFGKAVDQPIQRSSGLRKRLWGVEKVDKKSDSGENGVGDQISLF